jgi:outer membrane receptor protein involved in Fe transport
MISKRTFMVAGVAVLSISGGSAVLRAQDAANLDEVVVTAQGREQKLQDVPVAVSVVTGAELERINVKSLQDVSNMLGNVRISTGTLTNPINIRGIGSGNNSGFEQSVATFVDGLYRPRSRSTNAALLDLDRVEVLKGPQTTFFGANAIAGALNIATRKPGKEFTYNASALYAFDDGEYNVEAGVTLPASDSLSFRLVGRVSGMDGYITMRDGSAHGPNDDSKQGRVAVRWEPTADYRADLRFDVGRSRTKDAVPLELLNCPPGAPYPAPGPPPPGSPPTNCFLALIANPGLDDKLNFHSDSPYSWANYDFDETGLTNSWQLAPGTITAVTGYFHQQSDNRTQLIPVSFPAFTVGGYDPLPSNIIENYHQFSQELRFTSKSGERMDYMFGAYYAQSRWRNTSGTGFYFIPFGAILSGPPFNGPPFNIVTSPTDAYTGIPLVRTSDKTYSGFASASIKVTDQVRLNLGARYSSIRKLGSRSLTFGTSVNNEIGTFVPFPTVNNQIGACIILTCDSHGFNPADNIPLTATNSGPYAVNGSKFMPSAGLQFDLGDDVMAYVTYSNGFKAGGYSGAATANTFKPESVNAYEAGIKGTYLDRRLTFNADVFRMDYAKLQETAYTQTLASIVLNAAKSVSQGVEVNANWRATSHFALRTDLAYLDSKYKDFRNAPCKSAAVLAQTCGTALSGGQDMSGQRRGYAPEWSGSVGASFMAPIGANQLRIDPAVYFSSNYFLNAAADPLLRQGGYAKVDLRVGFGPEDNHWEVAVVGKNLGDKETVGFKLETPGAPGTIDALPERGRAVAVQFSLRN